jgi:hypothetical protein
MRRLRARRLFARLLVAAFALWLPAATGTGGKATCVAATAFAKQVAQAGQRPHLSCHGEPGAKKTCCCRGVETLRAAACGCHEGQDGFASAAHDPMLRGWIPGLAVLSDDRVRPRGFTALPPDRLRDAPDPPPPQLSITFPV